MLMDTEEQCHRTCFALNLDGFTLDAYTELKNIPGMKEGAEIKVLEGKLDVSYTTMYKRNGACKIC